MLCIPLAALPVYLVCLLLLLQWFVECTLIEMEKKRSDRAQMNDTLALDRRTVRHIHVQWDLRSSN